MEECHISSDIAYAFSEQTFPGNNSKCPSVQLLSYSSPDTKGTFELNNRLGGFAYLFGSFLFNKVIVNLLGLG